MISTNYQIYDSPFGAMKISYIGNKIVGIKKDVNIDEIARKNSKANSLTKKVITQLEEYFATKRIAFDFEYELIGTEFQKKVWRSLMKIPYGKTRTYKEIAIDIGNEKASRAVGMANNKNPITIMIPCHRVIGSNGNLIGYFGGVEMKKSLLELEKKHKNNSLKNLENKNENYQG